MRVETTLARPRHHIFTKFYWRILLILVHSITVYESVRVTPFLVKIQRSIISYCLYCVLFGSAETRELFREIILLTGL